MLGEIAAILREYIPLKEYDLYAKYLAYYERMKDQNDKQKQHYQDNAEYHRENTRKWRQENKDRNYAYQKEYLAKKRTEKNKAENK